MLNRNDHRDFLDELCGHALIHDQDAPITRLRPLRL